MKKEKLSSICDIKNGFAFKSSYYVDSGYRVIRITNVQKGHVVDNDPKFISKEIADKADDFKLRCGDILISLTGNVGRVGRIQFSHLPAVLNQRVGLIRPKSDKIDERYLFQYLNSDEFEQEAIKNSNGVAQLNLSSKWIENYLIPLPPPDDQKRIAYLLGKVEKLIGDRRSHLQQLDDLLKSVFLKMFGDPVRNEMGWDISPLGVISKVQNGLQVTSKREINPIEVPYLRVANVYRDRLDLREVKNIRVTEKELDKVRLKNGDILIVEGHGNPKEIGRSAVWNHSIKNCVHQNHLIRVRVDSTQLTEIYVSHFINSPGGRSQMFKAGKTTSGLNTINSKNVKEMLIPTPPINFQYQFVTIVNKVETIKAQYRQSLTDLETLYGVLSQKAFKGELDLSRIPLIEDSEEMTTDKTIEPQDSPPTTETYNLLPAPSNLAELETFEGRQALLEQWLNIWLEHLNNEPFSPQPFLDAAQQRLSELTEDNPLEWELGAADYEQITKWLIKSLDNGNIKQIYENTKNQVQVKAANP